MQNPEPERLEELLKYWKGIYGVLSGIVTILPLAGFSVKSVLPPGWLETALPIFGAVLSALLIGALYFLFSRAAPRTFQRVAIGLFVASVIFLLFYVFLRAQYVATLEEERHLLGPSLTVAAQTAIDKGEIANTPKDLLNYFGHESEARVWTYRPVIEWFFFLTFCGFWACAAGGFFLFTLSIALDKPIAIGTSKHSATEEDG